jgi:23S rRNA (guanine745-N1)-methyltransferase
VLRAAPPLACSVRDCGRPLALHQRAFVCSAGHSFDIARSGYISLLQPQDRRSPSAGDAKAAVHARAALEQGGIGSALRSGIIERIAGPGLPAPATAVDLGSGSGALLGALCRDRPVAGLGIDLSTAAAEFAARRFPAVTWVVANADRRLPLLDSSVDVVLSIHGRRNPAECARVLTSTGRLWVALPAPDDLVELRTLVLGQGIERDRVEAMVGEHQADFELIERFTIRERLTLQRDALLDLLRGTYRGARLKASDRVEALREMDVTLSSEVCVLRRRI